MIIHVVVFDIAGRKITGMNADMVQVVPHFSILTTVEKIKPCDQKSHLKGERAIMTHHVYAMDTFFYNSMGVYPFEVRAEMLKQLGYDATYLSLWSEQAWRDVEKLGLVKEIYGLDVAAVYVLLDLSSGEETPQVQRILNMLETIEGCRTIELAVQVTGRYIPRSDQNGDGLAVSFLEKALEICERRGLQILLYPHLTFWLERHEDAIRLCRRLNHPNLGIVFCGPHWYMAGGRNINAILEVAIPYIKQVNLAGIRLDSNGWAGLARTELIDEGEVDNFAILGALNRFGFDGMIGFQGWELGGDTYSKLRHSIQSFRNMERWVEKNPHWAELHRGN